MTEGIVLHHVGGVFEARGDSARRIIRVLRDVALWTGKARSQTRWEVDPITGWPRLPGGVDLIASIPIEEAAPYLKRLAAAGVEVRVIATPGPCRLPSAAETNERIEQHAAAQFAAMARRIAA